mgnify:CR=1 FL=1|tara:strand:+ start:1071 stop:1937 length:867 start_codon:yes stop_codon:yes gene_type:complete
MKEFNYLGRPDGIGNRIEEIINVNAYCHKNDMAANYVWINKHINRKYEVLISSENLNITRETIENVEYKTIADLPKISEAITQQEVLNAAQNIKPIFEIFFEDSKKPIGVHIRGTDRIRNNNHPHFMKNKGELFDYMSKTISLLNEKKPENVYVCTDDKKYYSEFIKKLDSSINVVTPICENEIPLEYKDFFALSQCEEIYMCSKFSTFALTASLIGNVPLVSFFFDEEVAKRYKVLFRYETDFTNIDRLTFENKNFSDYLNIHDQYVKLRLLITKGIGVVSRIVHKS